MLLLFGLTLSIGQVRASNLSHDPGALSFHIHTTTPNDPLFGSQPALSRIQLPSAWDESRGSATVKVGIIDTGIDGGHQDLAGRVDAGYNFITNATIPAGANSDDNGHGTLIAGVIGALSNNRLGIAGIDWTADLIPLKVANSNGEASAGALASAITYAADHGIRVVNMSLGSPADFDVVRNAVSYAMGRGMVMVASSGNNGSVVTNSATDCATVCYPAAYASVIAVGSVNGNDVRSSFSNYGPELDLVAPGENILSTALGDHTGYATASGTSLSAPFVSGVASLLLARFDTSPAAILSVLEAGADKPAGMNSQNFTNEYGYGRINAARAIEINAGFVSQNSYPDLYPGDAYQFEVILRNTGQSTWQRGQVNLGTDRARDRLPVFTEGAGWLNPNRVQLVESTVAPGQTGTFRFTDTVPQGLPAGTYREYFRPVFDNVGWLEDFGLYWDVHVHSIAETYHAAWVSQNSYPTLLRGDQYQFEVILRNTGQSTWQQGTVNLGTDQPRDRLTQFTRGAGWISPNRVGLVEASVAPGATGTFRFTLTVPPTLASGTYREYFDPVADGITWMENLGIYWDVRVLIPTPGYHAEPVSQNNYPTLSAGQSYQFESRFRNVGTEAWQQGVVNLGTDHARDRIPILSETGGTPTGWTSPNRVVLVESSVAPNGIGTFRFYYTVPGGLAPGIYREYFSPVADGITWMEDRGFHWVITVQ